MEISSKGARAASRAGIEETGVGSRQQNPVRDLGTPPARWEEEEDLGIPTARWKDRQAPSYFPRDAAPTSGTGEEDLGILKTR